MDLCVCIYVVLLCAGGIRDFQNVAAEFVTAQTADVDILLDIRTELDNLKLSNDLNERTILRLERQVNECNTKYADLTKQTSSVARIEKRLADIEYKVKASHEVLLKRLDVRIEKRLADVEHKVKGSQEELLKRLEAMETSRTTGCIRDIERDVTDNSGTVDEDGAKMNLGAGIINIDADKNNFYTDDEDQNESELTEVTGSNKRIIPVTSRPSTHTKVAFSAYLSHTTLPSNMVGVNIIPFDSVVTNEGLAFNPSTNEFTCPISGVYFFTSAFAGTFHEHVYASIMKNGDSISDIDSGSKTGDNQDCNSVVAVCNKDDRVWIRVSGIKHSTVRGDHFTTFTGFLMWEL